MSAIEALILGIVQGLTEFLPVSSSGHLELAKAITENQSIAEESKLMTIVLHFATALSTVVIFRREIAQILKGLFQFKINDDLLFSLKIILSMAPAAIIGVVFDKEIESLFGREVTLVGVMLIVTGILLFFADRAKKTEKKVGFGHAIIIGISQAIAILPGISRSGATISTSVLLGIDRERAARFSFLMVVPLIFGAMVLDTKKYVELNEFESLNANERSEFILAELEKESVYSSSDSRYATSLQPIMLNKELDWEKNYNQYDASEAKKVYQQKQSNYWKALEASSLLNKDQIKAISDNDFARFRSLSPINYLTLFIGFIAAFITGLLACQWMIKLVKSSKLVYFSIYCVIVGIIGIILTI